MPMRKTALALSLTLLASACGGSSSDSDGEAAADTTTTSEAPATTAASLVNIDRYCELAIEQNALAEEFFAGDVIGNPTAFEDYFVRMLGAVDEAYEVADPTIKAPLGVMREQVAELDKILASHGYDLIAASEDIDAFDDSEGDAAEEALDAYDERVCGIVDEDEAEPEPAEDALDEPSSVGTVTLEDAELAVAVMQTEAGLALVVDGFIEQVPGVTREQAACFLTSLTPQQFVDFSQMSGSGAADDESIATTFELMSKCDIPLDAFLPEGS